LTRWAGFDRLREKNPHWGAFWMEKILIVEDDKFFREMYFDLLKQDGYEVDMADSGEEALTLLKKDTYSLVITDLVMGGISGLELLTRIKQSDPTVDVIIITGNANIDSAIYALKNGARDYLVKPFNHDEFKHIVALSIEQHRLFDENVDLRKMIKLYQTGQAIANCLDMERLCMLIVDSLAKEVGISRALGFFVAEDGQLSLRHSSGINHGIAETLATFLMASVIRSREESRIVLRLDEQMPAGPEFDAVRVEDFHEVLLLYIRSRGVIQGVVTLFNNTGQSIPNEIGHRDVSFLIDQASLAYENAYRFASTKNLLYIDELTGLYNYRYLDVCLERELRRAERYSSTLAVIFMDIDMFKGVNDSHGHLVGSRLLREVGDQLRASVREVDTVVRYGGDEYTVILVETGEMGAAIVAERIRKAIQDHVFYSDDGDEIRITASLGYACYPDDTRSKQELLELADMAMYRGKAGGKNIVFRATSLKK
jgi:diguanylate cyclase (GGDEF)-like protein